MPANFLQSLVSNVTRKNQEEIKLKFVDTTSKFGHGCFQTPKEKLHFMVSSKDKNASNYDVSVCTQGKLKKDFEREREKAAAAD